MRNLAVEVTIRYEIEIDDNNEIVKEYANDKELIQHLADYGFSVLPVLESGVSVKDTFTENVDFWEL